MITLSQVRVAEFDSPPPLPLVAAGGGEFVQIIFPLPSSSREVREGWGNPKEGRNHNAIFSITNFASSLQQIEEILVFLFSVIGVHCTVSGKCQQPEVSP